MELLIYDNFFTVLLPVVRYVFWPSTVFIDWEQSALWPRWLAVLALLTTLCTSQWEYPFVYYGSYKPVESYESDVAGKKIPYETFITLDTESSADTHRER